MATHNNKKQMMFETFLLKKGSITFYSDNDLAFQGRNYIDGHPT